jgi:hypothetical protein
MKTAETGACNTRPGLTQGKERLMPEAANHSTPAIASPFSNLSTGQIIDELGQVKAEAAEIEQREKALKAALIARGVTEAEGALFRATVTESLRETLDAETVKAEMGGAWWSARCKVGIATTVRVSARKGVKLAA